MDGFVRKPAVPTSKYCLVTSVKLASSNRRRVDPTRGTDRLVWVWCTGIAYRVQHAERRDILVVTVIATRGATLAASGRSHDAIAGSRDGRPHIAPGMGELGKAVQQRDRRTAFGLVTGFPDVNPQPRTREQTLWGGAELGSGSSIVMNGPRLVMRGVSDDRLLSTS